MVICRIYAVFSGEFGMISIVISSHMHSDGDSNLGNQQKEWDLELIFSCQDLQQTVEEQNSGEHRLTSVTCVGFWSGAPSEIHQLGASADRGQWAGAHSWSPLGHSSVHLHPQAEEAHALQETSGGRGAQLDVRSPKWFQRLQSKMSRMVRDENE